MAKKIIPIKPLITEKGTFLSQWRQYLFQVPPAATKKEIAETISILWGVHPIKIRVINMRGKQIRYGRISGRKKNWKKAIVTLKEGEKIEIK